MATAEPISMTPTCARVIRNYTGDKSATDGMRRDVFGKAVTRCIRAGWLTDIDAWPYTGITTAGRQAIADYSLRGADVGSAPRTRSLE